jgi:MFS family permease
VIVFYAAAVLQTSVGLDRNTAIIAGGCINLAFAVGSLVPALGADRLGRKKPMLFGTLGMALSMMIIAILLSYAGTSMERPLANTSIAFFVTVSSNHSFIHRSLLTASLVHDLFWCKFERYSMAVQRRDPASQGPGSRHGFGGLQQLDLGKR